MHDPDLRGDESVSDHAASPWRLTRGATVGPAGVTFSVWAPRRRTLAVRLTGPDGQVRADLPMQSQAGGLFVAQAGPGVAPVGSDYAFVSPELDPRPDPVSRWQPAGVHGPSRIVDPYAFAWTDGGWRGVPRGDLIIYELHVGTFTPAGTFAGVASRLPYLRELGVTAIELMPVATFPGGRNWGYDGVDLYAPHSAYGGPRRAAPAGRRLPRPRARGDPRRRLQPLRSRGELPGGLSVRI